MKCELHAYHDWIMFSKDIVEWRRRMQIEHDYYDVKTLAFYIWGLSQWIGSGWCTDQAKNRLNGKAQTPRGIPNLGNAGRGVCRPEQHTSQKYQISATRESVYIAPHA